MKTAVIIHGWGGYPEGNWFPWLKAHLEQRGYAVLVPAMPNTDAPDSEEWLQKLQEVLPKPDQDVLIIGHSLGCITALRYAAMLQAEQKLHKIILVSGFIRTLGNPLTNGFFTEELDCDAVSQHVSEIIVISSDNDPYISGEETNFLIDSLHPTFLMLHEAGHINAASGHTELPEILPFI